jgi:hypothetical protein
MGRTRRIFRGMHRRASIWGGWLALGWAAGCSGTPANFVSFGDASSDGGGCLACGCTLAECGDAEVTGDGSSGSGDDATASLDSGRGPDSGGTDATLPPADAPGGSTNLITDGDFSGNAYAWLIDSGYNATGGVVGSEFCLTLGSQQVGGIGWPTANVTPLNLQPNATYTFSYTSRLAAGSVNFVQAKVGQSSPPYTADFQIDDPVSQTPAVMTHAFTEGPAGDTSGGISLFLTGAAGGEVCFSNVQLVRGG